MAKRNGQIVLSTLVTPDTRATFPVVDGNDIGGGRHIVQSLTDRNAIPAKHRKAGMLCYVATEDKDYKLLATAPTTGNTADADWTEYRAGVPTGIITSHQKTEDIVYADPVASGYNKLVDKLAAMDALIATKISTHQTVEDIRYASSVGGFSTLAAKLKDMDTKITAALIRQNIEDISWKSAPTGHPTALADELKNINDPTKIIITNADGTTTNLQAKINAVVASTPFVEDIKNKSNVPLSTLLTDASDPTKIIVDTTAGTTLAAKLAALNSATKAAVQHVEDIDYATATTEGYTHLTQKLADINNPAKIVVDAAGTTLAAKLATLTVAASSALQGVEDIAWKSTPTGHKTQLADELTTLFTNVATANTNATAANTTATAANTAATAAQTDAAKASSDVAALTTTVNNLSTSVTTANTNAAAAQTAATAAQTAATAAQTAAATKPTVEDVSWGTTPSGHQAKLSDELTTVVTKLADMNDPTKIMIDTKTLKAVIADLKAAQANNVPPIYLLYDINSPAAGSISCEYLTQYQSKLNEISFYTNADATMATDLVFDLEICGPTDTTYKKLAQCEFTLGASQTGKMVRTDLSTLTTPIYLADNTRLRIDVKSLGAADKIGSFNVRLTLQKDTTTGVTTNVTTA